MSLEVATAQAQTAAYGNQQPHLMQSPYAAAANAAHGLQDYAYPMGAYPSPIVSMTGASMSSGVMHTNASQVGSPVATYDSSCGGSSVGYTSNGTHWTQQFSEAGPYSAVSQASTWLMPSGRVRPVPRGQACDACADRKRKRKCWRLAPGEPCL
ncbi:hypothetical protein OBBRIDRAFT_796459 [Obba rivulosa]|uniref:Uncharacterized protein n=1 Tax=Obba rivulosa TaxID=1052685 RepID=A0A8E2AV02_9APHY|nr:hypothetical protein OBBRIDRAFT_796459 [Obba rivulosa]